MKPKIDELFEQLPEVFDGNPPVESWPADVFIINKNDNQIVEEIEDILYPDRSQTKSDPSSDLSLSEIDKILEDTHEEYQIDENDPINKLAEVFSDVFDNKYPGSPKKPSNLRLPSIEIFGFYLNWHRYNSDLWGIYIFAEGILSLGKIIRYYSKGLLDEKECNLIAKSFIYYHELYHNKVETFAGNSEVFIRQSVYKKPIAKLYKGNGFQKFTPQNALHHEESLANAYAYNRCVKELFKNYSEPSKRKVRKVMRKALYNFIKKSSPPKYQKASDLIFGDGVLTSRQAKDRYEQTEKAFREEVLSLINHNQYNNSKIWGCLTETMNAILRENGDFCYLISKKSKLATRVKLSNHYCSRRHFLKSLKKRFPNIKNINQKSGRHPDKLVLEDKTIPIPHNGCKEIPNGTCQSILRQLGINEPLRTFLRDN